MHFTDVSQLCSAIKNIEQIDLRRLVRQFGGSVYFSPAQAPYLEFYSNGPTSDSVRSVKVNEDDTIVIDTYDIGEVDSSAVYLGHLSLLSAAITEQFSRNKS